MKTMSETEIKEWLKGKNPVHSDFQWDESSNAWLDEVFEDDGKFYNIGYCNGHLCRDIPYKKGSDPTYTPVEVIKVERVVVDFELAKAAV